MPDVEGPMAFSRSEEEQFPHTLGHSLSIDAYSPRHHDSHTLNACTGSSMEANSLSRHTPLQLTRSQGSEQGRCFNASMAQTLVRDTCPSDMATSARLHREIPTTDMSKRIVPLVRSLEAWIALPGTRPGSTASCLSQCKARKCLSCVRGSRSF